MKEVLQEIGLSKNESLIYIKLSELGISTAYGLAKETKLFKANTYDSLKKLVERGLVSSKKIDGKLMYEAADPSFLIELLNRKKERVEKIIPNLRLLQNSPSDETSFNTFKGTDAFINMLYHLLKYNEPILVYGAPKIAYELVKYKINPFHKERIKRKIRMHHIYNSDAMGRIRVVNKMSYTSIKTLPDLFDSQVSTNICGKEVVFVIWKPPIKVIQIIDEDMADAYRNYFKILWSNAKKI